jgi:hypothetical protein
MRKRWRRWAYGSACALGRGVLRADANPFRPAVFLEAIDTAWRAFEPDELAHGLVQPLLGPDVVFDFAPLFEALVAELRKEGRPQQTAYHIQKNDDGAARAARASHRAALAEQLRKLFGDDGGEDGLPLIPELPDLPAGKGDWRPSAGAGFAAAPAGVAAAPAAQAPAAQTPATAGCTGTGLQAHAAAGFGAAAGSLTAPTAAHLAAARPCWNCWRASKRRRRLRRRAGRAPPPRPRPRTPPRPSTCRAGSTACPPAAWDARTNAPSTCWRGCSRPCCWTTACRRRRASCCACCKYLC